MPKVIAAWVEQFATRSIELQPDITPLDAVREAIALFPQATEMDPEVAAERQASRRLGQSEPAAADPRS